MNIDYEYSYKILALYIYMSTKNIAPSLVDIFNHSSKRVTRTLLCSYSIGLLAEIQDSLY